MRTGALVRSLIVLLAVVAMTTAATAQQRYALVTVRGASGLQADFYHWRLDTHTGALSRCLANMGGSTFECFDFPGEHPILAEGDMPRFQLHHNLSVQNTVATSIIRFDTVTGALLLCEIGGSCWAYTEGY